MLKKFNSKQLVNIYYKKNIYYVMLKRVFEKVGHSDCTTENKVSTFLKNIYI